MPSFGGYIIPTTYYQNQNNPLMQHLIIWNPSKKWEILQLVQDFQICWLVVRGMIANNSKVFFSEKKSHDLPMTSESQRGLVSSPVAGRRSRDVQLFFVNGRPIDPPKRVAKLINDAWWSQGFVFLKVKPWRWCLGCYLQCVFFWTFLNQLAILFLRNMLIFVFWIWDVSLEMMSTLGHEEDASKTLQ